MNMDERLEFLRQSTESLHASCAELHGIVLLQAEQAQKQREEAEKQRERDLKYINLIADVLKHWAEDGGENGAA